MSKDIIFSIKKDLDKLTSKDVVMLGETAARLEAVSITDIVYENEPDKKVLGELTKIYSNSQPDIPVGLARVVGKGNKIQFTLLTNTEHVEALRKLGHKDFQMVAVYNYPDFSIKGASKEELMYLGSLGAKFTRREEELEVKTLEFEDGAKAITDEEEELYDKPHSVRLKKDILDKGQDSPITVAARFQGKKIVHDVVDGLHRGKVFKEVGKKTCIASVGYGWTELDVWFKRILAAASVRSVALARFGIFGQKYFEKSEWSKMGLKLSQIVSLAFSDSSGKILFGRDYEKAEQAKKWAKQLVNVFSATTNLELGSTIQYIRAFEASFPKIIRRIRMSSGGGEIGRGVFPPLKFLALANTLPNDFARQKYLLVLNKQFNFNVPQMRLVGEALAKVKDFRNKTFREGFDRDPVGVAAEIVGGGESLVIETRETSKDENVIRANRKIKGTGRVLSQQRGALVGKSLDAPMQKADKALFALKESLGKEKPPEWLTTPGLKTEEAASLDMYLNRGMEFEEIASTLGVPLEQAEGYYRNALVKIHLHSKDKREAEEALAVQRASHKMRKAEKN